MAKQEGLQVKVNQTGFDDDPLAFCQEAFREAVERNDDLEPVNTENLDFYYGIDKKLEELANNSKVVRSSLFVHELTPAIDTLVGHGVSKLEERDPAVVLTPAEASVDRETKDQIAECQRLLNHQMRDCGYLSGIFEEQSLGAQIFRTPSTVKVGWRTDMVEEPEIITPSLFERGMAFFRGKPMSASEIKWRRVERGRPYAQWLHTHEFLYEPNVSVFEEDSVYAIHCMWLSEADIYAYALDHECDMDKVTEFFESASQSGEPETKRPTVMDQTENDLGTPDRKERRDGKWSLAEMYVITYDDSGEEVVNLCIMLGNKELIYNEPYNVHGVKFPFVPLVLHRIPGRMENLSTIDKAKDMQRVHNSVVNSWVDIVSYSAFPMFKKRSGSVMRGTPRLGPGEIWSLDDLDDIAPLNLTLPTPPDLPALLGVTAEKIKHVANAPDVSQGFNDNQYEKATKTIQRISGSERRSTPINKLLGEAIVKVAKLFIQLNRNFSDDPALWAHRMVVDVPTMTNVTDPEQEKREELLLISQTAQDPMFQTPTGARKRRNMWESLMRKIKKSNVHEFVPTEDEHEADLKSQADLQIAALEKQDAQEQMAMQAAEAQTQGGP